MTRLTKHVAMAIVAAALIGGGRPAFADDPCVDSKEEVTKLVQYLSESIAVQPRHAVDGTFLVTPRIKNRITLWYEIAYGTPGHVEVLTVMRNEGPIRGGSLEASARGNVLSLDYPGVARGWNCWYEITPTQAGFAVNARQGPSR